ncbi:MAG TPA: DUF6056 family protein [Kofleriaceae bacterium]|nr:DUF6056 family protein [Kofleriaceae bacterium]
MPAWSRILRAAFVAYVAATLVHVGWVIAHEPFSFDAWNVAVDTRGQPITLGRFFHYWRFEYTHSNPRLGQALTYLAYKLEYFAVIATPLAYLAISLAITLLGLARWPFRAGRDVALWAIVLGFMWFALPELGKTMFCRAYGANYLYGAAIQLWFLVPIRLWRRGEVGARWIPYALFGVAAGACNEHTGPTLIAFLAAYGWWQYRRRQPALLPWAGAAGALVGFCALLFAPGQGERYDSLAQKSSMFTRLVQRGFTGNLDILRDLLLAAAPVLALIAIVLVIGLGDEAEPGKRRPALRLLAISIVAAVAMAATIFVSPKLGSRFYLGSASLLLASFVALADVVLVGPRRLAPFVVVALTASSYAAVRTVPLYAHAKRASDARIAALERAPRDRVFIADAFDQVDDSWWFEGDDFRDSRKRDMVATYFGLPGVVFRAYDATSPLGVTSVRFVPHVTADPPSCADALGGLSLGSYKGFDLPGIQRELNIAIAQMRERLGGAGRLLQVDLAVELDDPALTLPRKTVLVGRWRPDRFEGYAGKLERRTREFSRDVVLPHELETADVEIYVYLVGDEAKRLGTGADKVLRYVPWHPGVYWILACRRDECFVIAGTHQAG